MSSIAGWEGLQTFEVNREFDRIADVMIELLMSAYWLWRTLKGHWWSLRERQTLNSHKMVINTPWGKTKE